MELALSSKSFVGSEVVIIVKWSMLYQALSERTRECSSLRLVEVLGVLLVEVGHVFEVLLWIVSNMRWDFNAL